MGVYVPFLFEGPCSVRHERLQKSHDCWRSFCSSYVDGNNKPFGMYKEHGIGHYKGLHERWKDDVKHDNRRKRKPNDKESRLKGPKAYIDTIPENIRHEQSFSI
ncbi:hypothetical protein AVEN_12728-1 [Araneus ventricosus]|uniref:Uncharacterized protein n=1 Tax=Araneus ventricosus TaxID=182803 RepID=A0A4Y2ADN1_ARAVE|nr:hypothetical protein AVEN_12728-1 [Araneus ventricosus]